MNECSACLVLGLQLLIALDCAGTELCYVLRLLLALKDGILLLITGNVHFSTELGS
jgi:hypothetical protein